MKSFNDALLDEARSALEDALRTGAADKWVTHWNLANIMIRQGDAEAAVAQLDNVAESLQDWRGSAFVLVHIPGRTALDSLVKVTDAGIGALLELQRALVDDAREDAELAEMINRCRASEDLGAGQAAEWVAESLAATG